MERNWKKQIGKGTWSYGFSFELVKSEDPLDRQMEKYNRDLPSVSATERSLLEGCICKSV